MYKIYCDGASRSNPGEASIGVSINKNNTEIDTIKKKIGIIPKKNRMNKTCPNGTSFKYLTIKSILLKQITDPTMYKTAF